MRGRHPDDDVLADLAADVLPVAEARAVEAHVMECEHCSRLLSDAERIRGLLLAGDPGPMPADVWARIEAALGTAGAAADTRPAPVSAGPAPAMPLFPRTQAAPPPDRADPPDAVPAARSSWQDDADPLDAPARWGSARAPSARADVAATGSLRRLSTTRRDAREGVRRGPRWALAAAGVAAAAVVAAVTVGTLRTTSGGGDSAGAGAAAFGQSSAESSATAAGAAGAAGVRYERTGTRYTAAALAKQARALTVAAALSASVPAASHRAAAPPAVPRAQVPGPAAGAAAPDATATDVSNPADLAGCLTALKASPDRVVAVDLATYDEREAAVIVLTAIGGGYEVFVVERTCSAADDHTLAYQAVKG